MAKKILTAYFPSSAVSLFQIFSGHLLRFPKTYFSYSCQSVFLYPLPFQALYLLKQVFYSVRPLQDFLCADIRCALNY